MTHIVIAHTDDANEIKVYFREPIKDAVEYVLAEFPISTAFTRDMAALVAAEYSHRMQMPIEMTGLSEMMQNHLRLAERNYGLTVTYRIKLGDK